MLHILIFCCNIEKKQLIVYFFRLTKGVPQLKVTDITEEGWTCTHQIVSPATQQHGNLEGEFPCAKEFAFTLDDFQKRAVKCVDNNKSVLVCAHTSAGKTTVAE